MKAKSLCALCAVFALSIATARAQYPEWQHSGSIFILTTPEGANLPASAVEEGFPLLVRLDKDSFDFTQAKPGGEDIRLAAEGKPLPYEVEEWDAARGVASLWVRIPVIKGNARQEIRLYWGNASAASESSGPAVFNESNGYLSVWHMNGPVKDSAGTLESKDTGTTATAGIMGPARHFEGRQGIFCGDKITNYPAGSSPHTSEAWFRAEKPNCTVLAWGNEQAQGKVVMQFRSPPHVTMDCYFSDANVQSRGALALSEWIHVAHVYQKGDTRLYVNGVLDGASRSTGAPLSIKRPARLWIGGWYNNYEFIGDIDEARVSKTARSADWVRLEYENQKPLQTLTGPVVTPGNGFSVSPEQVTVLEGKSATLLGVAGGAQKIYWILKSAGRETLLAVDRSRLTFDAGRVVGNQSATLQFRAVYANEVKTLEIPISIQEDVPEPVFTLDAPARWDGRAPVEVWARIANLPAMQAKGAGQCKMEWSAASIAVIKETASGKLILKRAQNSGILTVTATLSNGGQPVTQSTTIAVTEPDHDAWVAREPAKEEMPEDGQFYARDDQNEGTLYCNGTLAQAADSVFLKLYAGDELIQTQSAKSGAGNSYRIAVKLKPGLVKYRVEFGAKTGGQEKLLHTATNLVCGDAFLIDGQSNALATDTSEKSPPESNEWIRSYGQPPGNPRAAAGNLWCNPVWKARNGEKAELGWWGMELAKRLLESQKRPVFIINAAAGGTRIDQHQRNPADPAGVTTLYGRMLWRVRQAKLTHGIRGILWHQGENDQGADGPMGGYGWETYQPLFVEMAAGWKQDFPNARRYYVFQIWPNSCSMGGREGSGDMLREKQRTLPELFSNLSVLSTLGVRPPGGCHFPLAGWGEFARLIQPLIERDHYGKTPAGFITPPNLRRASYAGAARDTIALEFDQPVVWDPALSGQFYLDGEKDKVAAGSVAGNVLTLKLKTSSAAKKITYLKETAWSQDTLLNGANGLAALTFCNVPLAASPASTVERQ